MKPFEAGKSASGSASVGPWRWPRLVLWPSVRGQEGPWLLLCPLALQVFDGLELFGQRNACSEMWQLSKGRVVLIIALW